MSKVVDFVFNNLGRMGFDEYNHTQDNVVNNAHSSYMLTNHNGVNDRDASLFQTKYPTMNMKSSYHVGPHGYNIDESTQLMNSKLTNLKEGTPVIIGCGDVIASTLGAGGINHNKKAFLI